MSLLLLFSYSRGHWEMGGDLGVVARGRCRGMRRWPLHWGDFTRYTDRLTTARR